MPPTKKRKRCRSGKKWCHCTPGCTAFIVQKTRTAHYRKALKAGYQNIPPSESPSPGLVSDGSEKADASNSVDYLPRSESLSDREFLDICSDIETSSIQSSERSIEDSYEGASYDTHMNSSEEIDERITLSKEFAGMQTALDLDEELSKYKFRKQQFQCQCDKIIHGQLLRKQDAFRRGS
jgi:hypothetical protein